MKKLSNNSNGKSLGSRPLIYTSIFTAVFLASITTHAQISVTTSGSTPETFDSLPPAATWSTLGAGTDHQWTTVAAHDAEVESVAASSIVAQVGTSALNPPNTAQTAQWSSAGFYLQTRPTGNGMIFLMATLHNDSGGNITSMNINYDLAIAVAAAAEVIPGHRVYYSLSGAANSWVVLGNFGAAAGPVSIPVDLTATPWIAGTTMYILLTDNNATTNPDGAYDVDNFTIGSVVTGGVLTCPGITNGPSSVTITQCLQTSASFSIQATGSIQTIQWYRNNGGGFTSIGGASSLTYTLNPAGPADNGAQFQAIVGNSACSVTSSVATLTVIPDTTPPSVRYAVSYFSPTNFATTNNYSLTNITIAFSEPIDTNDLVDVPGNFTLVDTNTGNQVTINAAAAPDNRTLRLDTDPLDPTHGYTLAMDFVIDACAGNEMPHTVVPVYSFYSTPLALNASWKYLDTDIQPAANWNQIGFDDSAWLSGAGPFDAKRSGVGTPPGDANNCRGGGVISNYFYNGTISVPDTCLKLTSTVTGTNLLTAYFRTHFTYTGKTNNTLLELSGKFDDGAVVWLNGSELVRIGMAAPPTVITNGSPTARTVGDAEGRDFALFLDTGLLRNGDNLLAVDLHQQSLTSSDLTMGIELGAFTLEAVAASGGSGPHLNESINGNTFTITWSGGGTLQKSADISTPANWTTIPGAASPFVTNTTAATKQFFRVTVP